MSDQSDFNDMQDLEDVARVITSAVIGEPEPKAENAPDTSVEPEIEDDKISQASQLVAFVEGHTELFHDQNGDVYAEAKDTHETRRLDGRQFKDWLVSHFYGKTGKSPRDQAVREALSTLAGLGRFRGECRDVFIRVAMHENAYFLDLAEPGKNRAVRISAGKWEVVTDAPVRFIRPETIRPLPEPKRGGNLAMLWKIANIPDDSRLLVLAWLGECLRPDTPFPVLELMGEQGSAKSTTQTALRRLIDPNACDLRSAPKAVEDMFVGAGASWLVSYENISHLSAPMQDALCVLATGGGFAKRKLYSDADESVITVKRPVVLNGISVAVTAQDLVDRTLSIETPVISERVETTELWRNFDAAHGALLGAMLDVVAAALELLPAIRIPAAERPRLAEFARFGMAVAKATGKTADDFTRQFTACRQEAIARTIDASPVATAVIAWCEQNPFGAHDTAANFMNRMEAFKPQRVESWPWTGKGFADALRRAAPALRHHGIECKSLPKTGGVIRWEIGPRGKFTKPCPASPASPAEDGNQDMQDIQDIVSEFSSDHVEVDV
jgi:hypothetical protein